MTKLIVKPLDFFYLKVGDTVYDAEKEAFGTVLNIHTITSHYSTTYFSVYFDYRRLSRQNDNGNIIAKYSVYNGLGQNCDLGTPTNIVLSRIIEIN